MIAHPLAARQASNLDSTNDEELRTSLYREGLDHLLPLDLNRSPRLPTNFPARGQEPLPDGLPENLVNDRLQDVHAHPEDRHLQFDQATHSYFRKGVRVKESVTQLIHRFADSFDPDQTIKAMWEGNYWPRPGYLQKTIPMELVAKIRELPGGIQIARLLQQDERDDKELCRHVRWALQTATLADAAVLQEIALSAEEIKRKWTVNRDQAAREGTWMHAQFECLLNGGSVPELTPEIRLLLKFLNGLNNATVYRTEWKICADTVDVAGSIDLVLRQHDDSLIVVDWKRSSRMAARKEHFNRFMKPPLADMEDSAISHYRLQLNVYRWILQKSYHKVVADMYIVGTHPDNGDQPWIDHVPVLDDETDRLMAAATPLVHRPDSPSSTRFTVCQTQKLTEHAQHCEAAHAPHLPVGQS